MARGPSLGWRTEEEALLRLAQSPRSWVPLLHGCFPGVQPEGFQACQVGASLGNPPSLGSHFEMLKCPSFQAAPPSSTLREQHQFAMTTRSRVLKIIPLVPPFLLKKLRIIPVITHHASWGRRGPGIMGGLPLGALMSSVWYDGAPLPTPKHTLSRMPCTHTSKERGSGRSLHDPPLGSKHTHRYPQMKCTQIHTCVHACCHFSRV